MHAEYFAGFEKLEKLYLNSNQIKSVENECFSNLKKLRILDLFRNNLADVRSGAFWSKSLQFLSLADSENFVIDRKTEDNFKGLPNIRTLNIRNVIMFHQNINRSSIFSKCNKMADLNMQGTRILDFQAKDYLQHSPV